jgi:hypothetical protein
MGAAGFHGRVRDGIGWDTRAMDHRVGVTSRLALRARRWRAGFPVYRPFGLLEPGKLFLGQGR